MARRASPCSSRRACGLPLKPAKNPLATFLCCDVNTLRFLVAVASPLALAPLIAARAPVHHWRVTRPFSQSLSVVSRQPVLLFWKDLHLFWIKIERLRLNGRRSQVSTIASLWFVIESCCFFHILIFWFFSTILILRCAKLENGPHRDTDSLSHLHLQSI